MGAETRQRPWQRPAQQVVVDTALHGTAEVIRRAAVGAAQDRSLDIVRQLGVPSLDWFERPPWYTNAPVRSVLPPAPTTVLRHGVSDVFAGMKMPAYGLRAFANPLVRGIGKVLGLTIGKVPVVGTAIEMLHSSPIADGTRRAAGREMLNRYRTGRDPFQGMVNLTDLDRRRASTFMLHGYNPLYPTPHSDGRMPVFAGDLRPDQGLSNPARQVMIFEPEVLTLSPHVAPGFSRARPWCPPG